MIGAIEINPGDPRDPLGVITKHYDGRRRNPLEGQQYTGYFQVIEGKSNLVKMPAAMLAQDNEELQRVIDDQSMAPPGFTYRRDVHTAWINDEMAKFICLKERASALRETPEDEVKAYAKQHPQGVFCDAQFSLDGERVQPVDGGFVAEYKHGGTILTYNPRRSKSLATRRARRARLTVKDKPKSKRIDLAAKPEYVLAAKAVMWDVICALSDVSWLYLKPLIWDSYTWRKSWIHSISTASEKIPKLYDLAKQLGMLKHARKQYRKHFYHLHWKMKSLISQGKVDYTFVQWYYQELKVVDRRRYAKLFGKKTPKQIREDFAKTPRR